MLLNVFNFGYASESCKQTFLTSILTHICPTDRMFLAPSDSPDICKLNFVPYMGH